MTRYPHNYDTYKELHPEWSMTDPTPITLYYRGNPERPFTGHFRGSDYFQIPDPNGGYFGFVPDRDMAPNLYCFRHTGAIDLSHLSFYDHISDGFMADGSADSVDFTPLRHVTRIGGDFLAHSKINAPVDLSSMTELVEVGDMFMDQLKAPKVIMRNLKKLRKFGYRAFNTTSPIDLEGTDEITEIGPSYGCNTVNLDLRHLRRIKILPESFMREAKARVLDTRPLTCVETIENYIFDELFVSDRIDLSGLVHVQSIGKGFLSRSKIPDVDFSALVSLKRVDANFMDMVTANKRGMYHVVRALSGVTEVTAPYDFETAKVALGEQVTLYYRGNRDGPVTGHFVSESIFRIVDPNGGFFDFDPIMDMPVDLYEGHVGPLDLSHLSFYDHIGYVFLNGVRASTIDLTPLRRAKHIRNSAFQRIELDELDLSPLSGCKASDAYIFSSSRIKTLDIRPLKNAMSPENYQALLKRFM